MTKAYATDHSRITGFGQGESVHAIPDISSPQIQERLTNFRISSKAQRLFATLIVVGAIAFFVGLWVTPHRALADLLLVSFFLIGTGVLSLFIIATQYLTSAGWSIVIRRILEAMTALIPFGGLGVCLVLTNSKVYAWLSQSDEFHFVGFKAFWLNPGFFMLRAAIYLAIWLLFAWRILKNSRAQDRDGDIRHTKRNAGLSAVFVVLFALSFWLASVDWLMTLEPHWYSTIFGVYSFAGAFTSALACAILVFIWLMRHSALRGIINEEHLHDLGKLLFGFSTFWAYIWFSQYMLIWYANIPEETVFYIPRVSGALGSLFLLNMVLNWVVPFLALLPRGCKRSTSVMAKVAVVVLVGRWLDLWLTIHPAVLHEAAGQMLWLAYDALVAVGGVGIGGLVLFRALGRAPLLPLKDPFLQESLHYHQ